MTTTMLERFPVVSRELGRSRLAYNSSTPMQFLRRGVVYGRGAKSGLNRFFARAVWVCGLAGAFLLLSGVFAASVQAQQTRPDMPILVANTPYIPNVHDDYYVLDLANGEQIEQSFTTGPHPGGYRVFNLGVVFKGPTVGASYTKGIYRGSTQLYRYDGGAFEAGALCVNHTYCNNVVLILSNILLRSSTTYQIRVWPTSDLGLPVVGRPSGEQNGLFGWTIADSSSDPDSGPLDVYLRGAPVLGAPQNIRGAVDSDNNVTITWLPPLHDSTGEVKHYVVETCTAGCDRSTGWSELGTVTDPFNNSGQVEQFQYRHAGGAAQATRRYRVSAYNGYQWPSAEWALAPRPIAVSIVSIPWSGNTYQQGEHIDIAVDFSAPVNVGGTPNLALAIGDDPKNLAEQMASYNSGSGTTRLIFRYTVAANVVDSTGLQLYSNPLRTNLSNRISEAAEPRRVASLSLSDWQALLPTQYIDVRNGAPAFPYGDGVVVIVDIPETVADGTETTARNISTPITATDENSIDTLTYSLEGADADFFEIDAYTAQITTKLGERYDHEAKASYSVTQRVNDGSGGTDTVAVSINITDVDEPPLAPDRPSVSRAFGTTHSLDVSLTEPGNAGRPEIDHYDVQYREGARGDWTDGPQDVRGTSATITRLIPDSDYQVQVRAVNHEGDGEWSEPGSGRTWPPQRSATGAPDISGGWQVGRLLTASKGDIADDNGVPPESEFTWQWLRVDGSSGVEISGATGKTYTLTAADAGKWVKIKATFRDGLGNEESRTSLPYPAYGSVLSATCVRPSLGSRREIWSGRVTAGAIASDIVNGRFEHGYSKGRVGRLSDMDFMLGPTRREIVLLSHGTRRHLRRTLKRL